LLFVFLLWVWSRRTRRGEVMVAFTMGYGFLRFLLELLRGDGQRGGLFGLSTSQIIGALTFFAAGVLWLWMRRTPVVVPVETAVSTKARKRGRRG